MRHLALALALAACDDEKTTDDTAPAAEADADTDTDSDTDTDTDTDSDTDADTDTDSDTDADTDADADADADADCESVYWGGDDSSAQYQLTLESVSDTEIAPGGSLDLTVRMTNVGADDSAYPSLVAQAGAGGVVSPGEEIWFAMFSGDWQEATFTLSADAEVTAEAVEVSFEASRLHCEGADCPAPNTLTVSVCTK